MLLLDLLLLGLLLLDLLPVLLFGLLDRDRVTVAMSLLAYPTQTKYFAIWWKQYTNLALQRAKKESPRLHREKVSTKLLYLASVIM
ncbi:unnamed protein product [Ectocarpus sp. 12 AP-2014]